MPGVRGVTKQGGAGDRGADLIVELEFGSIPELVQTLVVQVKSYQGTLSGPSAVDDIRRAFEAYKHADMGLIVSTATAHSESVKRALDILREEVKKPVSLLIGDGLATFFLKYSPDLFLE